MGDCKQNMDQLTAAIASHDFVQIRFYSHRIKGSAATVGATTLSGTAGQIEDWSGRAMDTDYQTLMNELCRDYHNVNVYVTKSGYLKYSAVESVY